VKKILVVLVVAIILAGVGAGAWWYLNQEWVEPRGSGGQRIENKMEKYDFDSLKEAWNRGEYNNSQIEILGQIKAVTDRRKIDPETKKYQFITRQIRFKSGGKWITGMINYFGDSLNHSVVIMVRGYAEKAGYYSGSGSWKMADHLAKSGMITVSLDFLGYAQSEGESTDMMEARFEKVPAVLDLVGAVKRMPGVDPSRIGFWAHSNGGQITLSAIEVMGGNYPTVLWAPMTQKFPDSIIETASELEDGGRAVKAAVGLLAKYHDPRRYAFENYYSWINSPVVIFQGTKDPWCEVEWQRGVVAGLTGLGKRAELRVIDGAGHNMEGQNGEIWKEVAAQTVSWLANKLNGN
jgi:alpha-beta hydrolase superfamily lysophospholipase